MKINVRNLKNKLKKSKSIMNRNYRCIDKMKIRKKIIKLKLIFWKMKLMKLKINICHLIKN